MRAGYEHSATEVATQQKDTLGTWHFLQQQLKEAKDTIATLTEQLKQNETSQSLAMVSLTAFLYICYRLNVGSKLIKIN